MALEARLTRTDGSEQLLRSVKRTRKREDTNRQTLASVFVPRPAVSDVALNEGDDEVTIVDGGTDQFTGPLKNIKRRDTVTELVVGSPELYAHFAEPTPPKLSYTDAQDAQIVRDAVDAVPQLSRGTINPIEPGLDITFNHATRILQMDLVRDVSKGFLQFDNETVDYTASLGGDRTGTTLSPSNQNVTESRVKRDAGENVLNHLRMIGAGSTSRNVQADSYSSSDRAKWGRAYFPDVSNGPILTRFGKTLLSELSTDWKEVDATLTGLSTAPVLGDTFTVDHPEQGIDQLELDVVTLEMIRDDTGVHYRGTLSNRPLARRRAFEKDIERRASTERTSQTTQSPNIPNAHIPFVRLPAGDSISETVGVGQGNRLYLWQTDIRGLGAASAPQFPDVKAQLVSAPSTNNSVVEFESAEFERGNPLATIDGATAADFRIDNGSSSTVDVAATFSYSVEPTAGV